MTRTHLPADALRYTQNLHSGVRRHWASLRLEGFDTQPADVYKPLATRKTILAEYRDTPL